MITFALFSALATFYFTMFITPGPNNIILSTNAVNFGFRKTIPLILGVSLGYTTLVIIINFALIF